MINQTTQVLVDNGQKNFVIQILFAAAFYLLSTTSHAQERQKMYLNFFGGMASFKSDVTNIGSSNFVAQTLNSFAPTGLGLSIGFMKNTYLDLEYSVQTLENEYSLVEGKNYASGAGGATVFARNNSIKIKQEFTIYKGLKFSPFVGISFLHLDQPEKYKSDLTIHSKSRSGSIENGIETIDSRDSTYHSVEYLTNRISALNMGAELKYFFNDKISCYMSYTFLYSKKYYSHVYAEYYRTDTAPQFADIYLGKSGHYLQLGISWHILNLVKIDK
jgi:hypothetical protein